MRLFTLYVRHLVSHAVKAYFRQESGITLLLGLIAKCLSVALFGAAAFAIGIYAEEIASLLPGDGGAIVGNSDPAGLGLASLIAEHYLLAFFLLIAVIALLPDKGWLDVRPYRHLPMSRLGVGLMETLLGLLRIPLLVVLGLATGLYVGGAMPQKWMAASVLFAVASTCTGGYLRHLLRQRPRVFFPLSILAATVVVADGIGGAAVANRIADLLSAGWGAALGFAAATSSFALAAAARASRMLDDETTSAARGRWSMLDRYTTGPVRRMAVLEWKMLRRCSYPRYQARGVILLLGVLLITMVLAPDDAYRLVTTLFVIAGAAMSYAQLAFAWNGAHIDGLFALPISAGSHVHARYLVGAALGSISLAALLAVSAFSAGDPVLVLLASYVFTLGWLIAPMMGMSMAWSRPVSLEGNAIGNLRAYSWHLYIIAFGLWMSTQLLVSVTTTRVATLAMLGIGTVGVVIQPAVLKRLAIDLEKGIPTLAERLRTRL